MHLEPSQNCAERTPSASARAAARSAADIGDAPQITTTLDAVASAAHTLASTDYGSALAAIVRHRNFHGMQFHPERSAAVGARLLRNFLDS